MMRKLVTISVLVLTAVRTIVAVTDDDITLGSFFGKKKKVKNKVKKQPKESKHSSSGDGRHSFIPSNTPIHLPSTTPTSGPTTSILPTLPFPTPFECSEKKLFSNLLYLDVSGYPDAVFDEREVLQQSVGIAYERSIDSLCASRSLDNIKLFGISENGNFTDFTDIILRYLEEIEVPPVEDSDDDDFELNLNFTLFFSMTMRCFGCPSDAKLFNDASRRRWRGRSLQVDDVCYCDSDSFEDSGYLGSNIAPRSSDFVEEFNKEILIQEVTSVVEAFNPARHETVIISPTLPPKTSPTLQPTQTPVPSLPPSPPPKELPTSEPSIFPTTAISSNTPSLEPSISPATAIPSNTPIHLPSTTPTSGPTTSILPTLPFPTPAPSPVPSFRPSGTPSTTPTSGPTTSILPTFPFPTPAPSPSPSFPPTEI